MNIDDIVQDQNLHQELHKESMWDDWGISEDGKDVYDSELPKDATEKADGGQPAVVEELGSEEPTPYSSAMPSPPLRTPKYMPVTIQRYGHER